MADKDHTIALRAGYAAWGRRGTGRAGWHAVSEEMRMPVARMRMTDAPVAFRVERTPDGRTWHDSRYWANRPWLAIPPVPADGDGVDRFDIRSAPGGALLAPVPGPWGSGTVTPEALAAYAAELLAVDDRCGRDWRSPRVHWDGYPGQVPVPHGRPKRYGDRWPAPAEGNPGRPAAACPDLVGERLTVDETLRAASLDAFRARCAGLTLLDGTLWRPCGAPLVAVDAEGRSRLVMPGRDAANTVGCETLALANAGTLAGHGGMPEAASAVATAAGNLTTDVEGRNVASLAAHVGAAVRAVRLGSLSPAWLPLVHRLATLDPPGDGEAAWPLSDAILALLRDAAATLTMGQPRPGSPDARLLDVTLRWAAVQEGERDMRGSRRAAWPGMRRDRPPEPTQADQGQGPA